MNLRPAIKSSKTTAVALLLLGASVLGAIAAYIDGDPTTVPNLDLVVNNAVIALGLFFARDADKRSEDVGA